MLENDPIIKFTKLGFRQRRSCFSNTETEHCLPESAPKYPKYVLSSTETTRKNNTCVDRQRYFKCFIHCGFWYCSITLTAVSTRILNFGLSKEAGFGSGFMERVKLGKYSRKNTTWFASPNLPNNKLHLLTLEIWTSASWISEWTVNFMSEISISYLFNLKVHFLLEIELIVCGKLPNTLLSSQIETI